MTAVRKVAVFVATLFIGLSALLLTAGPATADCPWDSPDFCSVTD